jgi:TolB-like protein/Flp pilus assembly protein TadD
MLEKARNFVHELSRRHVFKVGGVYAAAAFILFQAADLIFKGLGMSPRAFSIVVYAGIAGFPITLLLAWAYDLTSEGVVRTAASDPERVAPDPDLSKAPWPPDIPRTSVAVLPFENLSGDSESDYFSDGITDEVITVLCKVPGLKVVSRTSVMQYRKTARNLRHIGRELRAGSIMQGTVRRAGDRVRVTAQLIDAATDAHLWAESYDRNLEDVFAIQSDLAFQIAGALQTELTSDQTDRIKRTPTTSVEAYDLYLRGRHFWGRRTLDDLKKSVEYFEEALAIDRKFALAIAGLADSLILLGLYGGEKPDAVMRRARDAADRALDLDSTLASAMAARACVRAVYDWDWSAAEREFKQATRAASGEVTAHQWFAMHCLTPIKRFDEAQEELRRAAEKDPLSPAVRASMGVVDYFRGRHEQALKTYETVLDTHPEFALAHQFKGQTLLAMGRTNEAIESLDEAARLSRRAPEVVAALGHAQAVAGNRTEAEALAKELNSLATIQYVSPVLMAQILVGLGDQTGALSALRRAHAQRASDLIWISVRPVFEPMHGDEGFESLAESIGLPSTRPPSSALKPKGWAQV